MNLFNWFIVEILFLTSIIGNNSCNSQQKKTDHSSENFTRKRIEMVEKQIVARGVSDERVLNAFRTVERHKFVPEFKINQAYDDHPISIGEGQTISQPYVVAFMTEVLELSSNDKVLEIGTGSGYQAAILGELCDSVFTIEIFESLGSKAEQLLSNLGYSNIHVKIGDGYEGWEKFAPFDAIIVTCSPKDIPKPLEEQLVDGGRMIIPVGNSFSQNLILLKKTNNQLHKNNVLPVRFVPMIDSTGIRY